MLLYILCKLNVNHYISHNLPYNMLKLCIYVPMKLSVHIYYRDFFRLNIVDIVGVLIGRERSPGSSTENYWIS